MIVDIIKNNKRKIIVISAISALSGGANILLLKLASTYAVGIEDAVASAVFFWWALVSLILLNFLSQYLLVQLSAKITYEIREKIKSITITRT